jgi:uncharacterized protein (DUF4415 family)
MADTRKLIREQRAALKALAAMPDEEIDTTDIPEVTDWTGAKRGLFYRPIKQLKSLRIDADVLAWFQKQGPGYQSRINAVLREYVERQ